MHYLFYCLFDPDMNMPLPMEVVIEDDTAEKAINRLTKYVPVAAAIVLNNLETFCLPSKYISGIYKAYNAEIHDCEKCSTKESKRAYLSFSNITDFLHFITMASATGCVKYIPKDGEELRFEIKNVKEQLQPKIEEALNEVKKEQEIADKDFLSELGIGS